METPVSKKAKLLEISLRLDLSDDDLVNSIKCAWRSSPKDFFKSGIEIISDPFPVCVIRDFISGPELLKIATKELEEVTFYPKSNDLYSFKQSDDVRKLTNFNFVSRLYDLIREEAREWVSDVLGGNVLKEDISATISSYEYQDRLLCHDDKCEDRHIAFILYLVDDWNEDDGGFLQLFSADANGYPSEIVKSICPEFNMMIFFEVTPYSFHQVSEVMSKTKKRLSINGWFHSSEKKSDKVNCVVLDYQQVFANNKDFNLEEYFLFIYFENMNKIDIKNIFSTESEIQLDEFIVPKFLHQIECDLRSEEIKWIFKRPANIRKYELADARALPPSIQTLKEIFESKLWFRYLKSITGLDFSPSETSDLKVWERGSLPHCNFEVQRWTHSCYTLIHDQDPEFHTEALDVVLRFPFQGIKLENENEKDVPEAGHIIYIDSTSKDEECLLHIGYKMNSLSLVFRDEHTMRFTKYLDSTTKPFYQILCTYRPWKPPRDDPNIKHCEEDDSTDDSVNDEENNDDGS